MPFDVEHMTGLTELFLGGNAIEHLPAFLGRLSSLCVLQLDGNPLKQPPPEIVSTGCKGVLKYLSRFLLVEDGSVALDLSGLKMTSTPLPFSFRSEDALSKVESLSLYNNELEKLSALEKFGLPGLRNVNARNNRIVSMDKSDDAFDVQLILSLDLCNNAMTQFSQSILQLTALKRLNLGSNGLTELPFEVWTCVD